MSEHVVPYGVPHWFLDWNAGAPAREDVLACFLDVERSCPANPASAHADGRRARGVLEAARSRIAAALELEPDDVVFTSGGTEAANLAVLGLGDPALPVLLSPAEHPAVWEPAHARGVHLWSVDQRGAARVTAPEVPVGLLCLVHAQSELGTLQPVLEAAELAASLRRPLFVDAAQALGRTPLRPVLARGAVVGLSPHKAGGLRGHGVLAGRGLHRALRPLLRGGGQELGLRPGTQSPALDAANAPCSWNERLIGQRPDASRSHGRAVPGQAHVLPSAGSGKSQRARRFFHTTL
jgi:cysteine desulfurase